MSQKYEDHLYAASMHEEAGRLNEAIACLRLARKYTTDHMELVHLSLWQERLEREKGQLPLP